MVGMIKRGCGMLVDVYLHGHIAGITAGNDQAVAPLEAAAHLCLQVQLHTHTALAQQCTHESLPACSCGLHTCTPYESISREN